MSIAAIIRKLPEFASNVKSEMKSLFVDNTDNLLNEKELYRIALSAGYSLKNEQLLNNIRAEAKMYLEEEDAIACKVASISMAGKNVFHFFTSEVLQDTAQVSRSFMKKHIDDMVSKVEKSDFYMCCLAASMLSACKYCMKFYTDELIKMGIQQDVIVEIVRVIAVLKAAAHALELEGMRSYDFVARDSNMS
ncbi:Alkylhydroperoxidase family protein [Candidatus Cyrtobacter comes]|uniref:Alkylhydroperoxidase family protein n=1 Tax=Candidatus Cyrtobacter comes TaxID=675776 RepID=A0ABU5L718_9RICK|nr:carboxymuconolactone decarboxylase family protein [Candidatus Cyrtobacter comes]MDZ5761922.1 Alkylhydroperoxidase family protein [Candidatus Cyrtobacter comes]